MVVSICFSRIVEIKERLGETSDISFAATLNNLANLNCLNVRYENN